MTVKILRNNKARETVVLTDNPKKDREEIQRLVNKFKFTDWR